MSDLLGCPFCGKEPCGTGDDICCSDKDCAASDAFVEAEGWNRRAILPRERALLEAARYALDAFETDDDDTVLSTEAYATLSKAIAAYDAEEK